METCFSQSSHTSSDLPEEGDWSLLTHGAAAIVAMELTLGSASGQQRSVFSSPDLRQVVTTTSTGESDGEGILCEKRPVAL